MNVKKIVKEIYHIDYSNIPLDNRKEFIVNKQGINEFTSYLRLYDVNSGIIVIPTQYKYGMFVNIDGPDQYIFSVPHLDPDIVTFALDIYGTKKSTFYRIKIIAKSTGDDYTITKDRKIQVVDNNNALILDYDFSDSYDFITIDKLFYATGVESILKFNVGKVCIKDIIIEEVEVENEEETSIISETADEILGRTQDELVAYGYFDVSDINDDTSFRYVNLKCLSGHGILLTYDRLNSSYILERNNINETIIESLNSLKYYVEINTTRMENVASVKTTANINFSPTTMKQGYYTINFISENNKPVSGIVLIKVRCFN